MFHKDGGVRTIELQILSPIIDSIEMAGDFEEILGRLNQDQHYLQLFQKAFDTVPTIFGITRAIASYERSLLSESSAFDDYMNGDSSSLSPSQKRGVQLFTSNQLKCNLCHSGTNFTNYTYQNIGLEIQNQDSGRARITMNSEDAGKFEVPSLRNVSITGPYMHNGTMTTLPDVIDYLAHGGGNHPNKSELIQPFTLTEQEKLDLLHFLESLTDKEFVKN